MSTFKDLHTEEEQPGEYSEDVLSRLVIAEAADSARAGNYKEAESLLTDAINHRGAGAEVYDLLARIRAQQGRLLEAEALWRELLRLDPSSDEARQGLQRIASMQRRLVWPWSLAMLFAWLGVILVVVLLASLTAARLRRLDGSIESGKAGVARMWDSMDSRLAALENSQKGLSDNVSDRYMALKDQQDAIESALVRPQDLADALQAKLEKLLPEWRFPSDNALSERISKVESALANRGADFRTIAQRAAEGKMVSAGPPPAKEPIEPGAEPGLISETTSARALEPSADQSPLLPALSIPDVEIVREGPFVILKFPGGLFFSSGVTITERGKAALAATALTLRSYARDLTIHVEGHTDETPVAGSRLCRDHEHLGLLRAAAAAQFLRESSYVLTESIVLSTKGASDPPYTGGGPWDPRNRTVVIRLSSRGKRSEGIGP